MPAVSVILPTYNRANFLAASISSVLSQTFTDIELIIADDGSDDEVYAYLCSIEHPAVRVIRLPHSGNPARVRNAALRLATGHYVAFQDSDDVWKPRKLELQIEGLAGRRMARWGYSACDRIDADGAAISDTPAPRAVVREGWIFPELLRLEVAAAMPTLIVERQLLVALEGFDECLPFGEFHDLCLRLALESPAAAVSEPLCSVRVHRQHYHADRVAALASWMRLYEKFAQLAPDPGLRAFSARMRAVCSTRLAAQHVKRGESRRAWGALRRSLPFSWRYAGWWWDSLKVCARTVPRVLGRSA